MLFAHSMSNGFQLGKKLIVNFSLSVHFILFLSNLSIEFNELFRLPFNFFHKLVDYIFDKCFQVDFVNHKVVIFS
jgi:hypothetical protein